MKDTIATYSEKKVRAKRHFELYQTRIRIQLHQRFGQRYDLSVKLCNIDPRRDKIWVKDPVFESWAGGLFVLSLVFVFGLLPIAINRNMWIFGVPLATVLLTFIALLFHNRRVEVARFVSISGTHAFDIGQFGTTKDEFEQFVTSVESQIEVVQKRNPNHGLVGIVASAPNPQP